MLLRKKHVPFLELSRKKQGRMYIGIKNEIRRSGRIFHTHDVLDGDHCVWADFWFLSRKGRLFYNATIDTCQNMLIDNVESEISDRYGDGFFKYCRMEFERVPGREFSRLNTDSWDVRHEELGNRSWHEYFNHLVDQRLAERPRIREEFKLYDDYACGIGMRMTVDEDVINAGVIEKYIRMFWDMGERDWIAPEPVPEDRLVYRRDWWRERNVCLCNALDI